EVDDEDGGLAGLDGGARAGVAVGQVRRDDELAAAADLHAGDAHVPALDDAAAAELEVEGGAAVPGRVELLAGRPRHADVVHRHVRALGGLGAVALLDVGDVRSEERRVGKAGRARWAAVQ